MHSNVPIQLAMLRRLDRTTARWAILVASAALLALLVFSVYGHGRATSNPAWVAVLPGLNALFNATSAVFLVLAYRAVRRRKLAAHARYMLGALAASSLFLVSYIVYHALHGDTPFGGRGVIRPIYFFVLISHIGLSAIVLPFVLSSFFFGLSGQFQVHKKVSRLTLPIWLYVSVTGVAVFLMLRAYG